MSGDPYESMMNAEPVICADCGRALYGTETCPCWSCPECRQGKHVNCTGETLSAADEIVPCGCRCKR